jgi:SAM-dependent methyltransferase
MDIQGWEERYRSRERLAEDFLATPTPLLVETAQGLPPGRALDLACGTGRNALWLASRQWKVTAVDGSTAAIEALRQRAAAASLAVDARVADLERGEYTIEPEAWNLIVISYYLQRDLFPQVRRGLAPGGTVIAIVHFADAGEVPSRYSLGPDELAGYFDGLDVLHSYEGPSRDPAHKRPVAEIAAKRADNR